jgi:phosphate transport system substrate-binding protein
MTHKTVRLLLILVLIYLTTVQCQLPAVTIRGAGTTLAYSMFIAGSGTQASWFQTYTSATNGKVTVAYDGSSSSPGVTSFLRRNVDFVASIVPLTDEQRAAARAPVVHIPVTLGAIDLVYNLPPSSISGQLNLTASLVAQIYLRTITKWNDPQILALNPNLDPNYFASINPIGRADSTGFTYVFSKYLSNAAPQWTLGVGQQLNWTSGVTTVNRNNGVVTAITLAFGSIGYVAYSNTPQPGLTSVRLLNAGGNYVTASQSSITAALNFINNTPLPKGTDSWASVDLTNQPDPAAWPMVTFTYFVMYADLRNVGAKSAALAGLGMFVNTNQAQNIAPLFSFVPLPLAVRYNNADTIDNMIIADNYNKTSYYNPNPRPTPTSQSGAATFSIILIVVFGVLLIVVLAYQVYVVKPWRA